MGIVIGVIVVLLVAALFAVLTCKSKGSDLFKWVGIALFVAFFFTWVIPYGYFQGANFAEYGLTRLGFSDIPTLGYYSVYFCLTTALLLLVIGGFYGVLSKTESYNNLVNRFAKTVENNRIVFAVLFMVVFILLSSVLKSALVLVVFAPFVASVFLRAKTDKLTTMGITFGSILVGLLCATYGTEGLIWFNSYVGTDFKTGIKLRLIVGAFALVLFVLFNVWRLVKLNKELAKPKKKGKKNTEEVNAEMDDSLFACEEVKKPGKMWPAIVILGTLLVLVFVAFFDWNTNLNITIFNEFHTWLTELTIGEDFTVFAYILGTTSSPLGAMELTSLITFLLIFAVIYGLMEGLTVKEFAEYFGEGFGKMFKPTVLYVLSYSVFIVMYMSPYMSTITNWATGLTDKFNPYIMTLTAFVNNLFTADLGYTGYLVGGALQYMYNGSFDLIHTLFISTYGLVQVFMPTGGILLVGLSYFKLDYKTWFKYIWMFVVAIVVVLLVLATVVTYIM